MFQKIKNWKITEKRKDWSKKVEKKIKKFKINSLWAPRLFPILFIDSLSLLFKRSPPLYRFFLSNSINYNAVIYNVRIFPEKSRTLKAPLSSFLGPLSRSSSLDFSKFSPFLVLFWSSSLTFRLCTGACDDQRFYLKLSSNLGPVDARLLPQKTSVINECQQIQMFKEK